MGDGLTIMCPIPFKANSGNTGPTPSLTPSLPPAIRVKLIISFPGQVVSGRSYVPPRSHEGAHHLHASKTSIGPSLCCILVDTGMTFSISPFLLARCMYCTICWTVAQCNWKRVKHSTCILPCKPVRIEKRSCIHVFCTCTY